MAQNPVEHARVYGLSHNVAADLELEEGPPSHAQHGANRTLVPEHTGRQDHGPKTRRRIKEIISRKA